MHIYVCVYVYIYTHTCIYICIYTYIGYRYAKIISSATLPLKCLRTPSPTSCVWGPRFATDLQKFMHQLGDMKRSTAIGIDDPGM